MGAADFAAAALEVGVFDGWALAMSVVWSCLAAYWAGRLLGALIDDWLVPKFEDYGEPAKKVSSGVTPGVRYYVELHRRMGGW